MTSKSRPAPTQPPSEPAAPAETPQTAIDATTFNWATLAPPVPMPTKAAFDGIKANVLATVPEAIRLRAETSLIINTELAEKGRTSDAKRNRVSYHWRIQPVPDSAVAAEFSRLLYKYAKYRPSEGDIPGRRDKSPMGQVTARAGGPGWFRKNDDGTWIACAERDDGAVYGVRFSVRPFEARKGTARLPGTA
jgi:hypothetical protein